MAGLFHLTQTDSKYAIKKKKEDCALFNPYFKQIYTSMSNHSEEYKYRNHSKHGNSVCYW